MARGDTTTLGKSALFENALLPTTSAHKIDGFKSE